ncbi:hypothetical protein KRR39_05340 [Nocardioides panacis]|uniref:DUF6318 domain-containing protein n=1 Tax=Nocardioides panacis TaxID=2849501 RepID=A0A975Y174_9ACTN|nr:DUF6318 family protein [Nocardioides panacis]QWZ09217.1 hypothetical protein KRR39_05340 [Nocardioides panacis]
MIRRLLLPCVALVCALVLSSCGGGNDSPATVDGFPAYVTANNEKGAQSFARYWIDTLNEATNSGDTAKFKKLNKDSCTTCGDFAKQLDDIYGAGGRVETDGFKIKKIVNEAGVPAPGAGVSVVLTATPQKVYAKRGGDRPRAQGRRPAAAADHGARPEALGDGPHRHRLTLSASWSAAPWSPRTGRCPGS